MIPHIENGEASIIVAISTEGRKKAAAVMGTVSLGNKSIKGVAKVREAMQESDAAKKAATQESDAAKKAAMQESDAAKNKKPPMKMFMEQTPKLITPKYNIAKTESAAGREVGVSILGGDIDITIDGSSTRRDGGKDGGRLAVLALRMVKSEVAKMPDGTLLTNYPTDADGLGDRRAGLYKKAGFGLLEDGKMRSVVKNGKLTPISAKQYQYLMRNGHHN